MWTTEPQRLEGDKIELIIAGWQHDNAAASKAPVKVAARDDLRVSRGAVAAALP